MRGRVPCLAKGLPSDWDTLGGQCQGSGQEEVLLSLLGLLLQAVGLQDGEWPEDAPGCQSLSHSVNGVARESVSCVMPPAGSVVN